ncbi:MAG: hypothetical protein GTO18_15170 [Anaerolineales bacterium]|nr:hypothetical protein [Anaerolineales bacterium]
MNISTQVSKYFAAAADATATGEAVPVTTTGNKVTPLIDGRRYFREIRNLLNSLGTGAAVSNQFFYMTGWWLHLTSGPGATTTAPLAPGTGTPQSPTTRTGDTLPAFRLQDDRPGPHPLMAHLLATKAAAGVDVRVMGWVNPIILTKTVANQVGGFWNVVAGTLLSIHHLRRYTIGASRPLAKRVCALTIGHALGAMHLKMVVARDSSKAKAFIGGIDFVSNRVAGNTHPGTENWHDMAVMIEGPAVMAFYDLFRSLWKEQINRRPISRFRVGGRSIRSVESGTTSVPARTFPSSGTGKHYVQVARTLPQYRFSTIKPMYGAKALSFAPNGKFEVKVAWRKAIANASRYIYVEDQSFWSQEVMDWINARVKANNNVKVILLIGARDPADPPNDGPLVEAINNHLLAGLTAPQKARVGLFLRRNIIVHSKLTIIDDHWLFVGSANCMRRSLYTDGEMSVGVLDKNDKLATTVRVALWGEHFGKTPAQSAPLKNVTKALAVWKPAWGSSPPFSLPPARISVRPLPLPPATRPYNAGQYRLQDADSRQTI